MSKNDVISNLSTLDKGILKAAGIPSGPGALRGPNCWTACRISASSTGVSCPHPLESEGPMPEMSRIMSNGSMVRSDDGENLVEITYAHPFVVYLATKGLEFVPNEMPLCKALPRPLQFQLMILMALGEADLGQLPITLHLLLDLVGSFEGLHELSRQFQGEIRRDGAPMPPPQKSGREKALVRNGPSSSIQTHWRLELSDGCHRVWAMKMTVDCMGWESRFLGYTMHVIFDRLHKTQHIRSVIEGSDFVYKVWFHWIETILNMELVLESLPLSMKELFYIYHESKHETCYEGKPRVHPHSDAHELSGYWYSSGRPWS
uniref:Uncharacterized protein n=1 Tax=Fagus sylvatica TaxID=28930 RepID=A0A2N9ITF6_FAGSY